MMLQIECTFNLRLFEPLHVSVGLSLSATAAVPTHEGCGQLHSTTLAHSTCRLLFFSSTLKLKASNIPRLQCPVKNVDI
jgi:hypothetical protein